MGLRWKQRSVLLLALWGFVIVSVMGVFVARAGHTLAAAQPFLVELGPLWIGDRCLAHQRAGARPLCRQHTGMPVLTISIDGGPHAIPILRLHP